MRHTLLGDYADCEEHRAMICEGLAEQINGNPEHTDPMIVEAGREATRRAAAYRTHAEFIRQMIKRNMASIRGPR